MSGAGPALPEEEIWTGLSAVQRDTLIGDKLLEAEAMGWMVRFAEREEPDGSWSLWVAYEAAPVPVPAPPGPQPVPVPVPAPPTPQPAPRAPPAPGGAAEIAHHLRLGAAAFAVDLDCLGAIAAVESGFRPLVKNPNSSAFGLFQFITGTWNDVVRRHGAAHGVVAADRAVLRAQCLMGAAHLADNTAALGAALGRKPTHGECYAAHFFGLGDARRLFRMPRETPADTALGPRAGAVIGANRPIFIRSDGRMRSVGEVLQLFDTKMARGLAAARALPI